MLVRSLGLLAAFLMAGAGVAGAQDDEGTDAYPIAIIARPFILPQGAIQAGLSLGASESFDTMASALQVDYGLISRLQISAAYAMVLEQPGADFSARGDLSIQASYLYLTAGKLEGMAVATGGYSLAGEAALPVEIGFLFWYTVSDALAVYTVPTLSMALAEEVAEEVDDPLGATRPVYVSLRVLVSVQPIQTVYVEAGTALASIEISDSPTRLFGRDYVPFYFEGYFSPSNTIDVGLGVSWDDVLDASNALTLLALVRVRGGI